MQFLADDQILANMNCDYREAPLLGSKLLLCTVWWNTDITLHKDITYNLERHKQHIYIYECHTAAWIHNLKI